MDIRVRLSLVSTVLVFVLAAGVTRASGSASDDEQQQQIDEVADAIRDGIQDWLNDLPGDAPIYDERVQDMIRESAEQDPANWKESVVTEKDPTTGRLRQRRVWTPREQPNFADQLRNGIRDLTPQDPPQLVSPPDPNKQYRVNDPKSNGHDVIGVRG